MPVIQNIILDVHFEGPSFHPLDGPPSPSNDINDVLNAFWHAHNRRAKVTACTDSGKHPLPCIIKSNPPEFIGEEATYEVMP